MTSELLRAREMPGFSLGRDRVDIRGWKVYASDQSFVGWVDSLFVDMHVKAIRYFGVALKDARTGAAAGTVLVPVGSASLATDDSAVLLNGLTSAQLIFAPRVPHRPVTQTDEQAVLGYFGLAACDVPVRELYNGPTFEERRLFGNRGASA